MEYITTQTVNWSYCNITTLYNKYYSASLNLTQPNFTLNECMQLCYANIDITLTPKFEQVFIMNLISIFFIACILIYLNVANNHEETARNLTIIKIIVYIYLILTLLSYIYLIFLP